MRDTAGGRTGRLVWLEDHSWHPAARLEAERVEYSCFKARLVVVAPRSARVPVCRCRLNGHHGLEGWGICDPRDAERWLEPVVVGAAPADALTAVLIGGGR